MNPLDLDGDGAAGVLASQHLHKAIANDVITADAPVDPAAVQPASLDLRLGDVAYRMRTSVLPNGETVAQKMGHYIVDEIDLREGAVLETRRPYLIPLQERLALPEDIRARTNPKSSTGRLDVFTRVVADRCYRFDEIPAGYDGPLYLEVVPLSFVVRVATGLSLNQLRLIKGRNIGLSDTDLAELHAETPLLYDADRPVAGDDLALANGVFLSLDLEGGDDGLVGFSARPHTRPVDMTTVRNHDPRAFWDLVPHEQSDRIVLAPERFYLLLSNEGVAIPPTVAAEMTAYDPTAGELRTHYAGFFDPGFGFDPSGSMAGSRAALEVRAHDVPFLIEHGQKVCKLTFEHMLAPPDVLYGADLESNYQGQTGTLSKHFRTTEIEDLWQSRTGGLHPDQGDLFES